MRVVETVWPVTALYFGPLALWGYYRWGRPQGQKWTEEHGGPPKKFLLFGWKLFGIFLYAKFVVNYILAYVLGIATAYPVNWWLIKRGIEEPM